MSNSPPANLHLPPPPEFSPGVPQRTTPPPYAPLAPGEAARVLAHNFDSLFVAIDVIWEDEKFLTSIGDLKAKGETDGADRPGRMSLVDQSDTWRFNVKPYGLRGYAFVLESGEMTMKLTASLESRGRPNVYVEFRSEALWRSGPQACIERIITLLVHSGANIQSINPSRVDLCADILIHTNDFTPALMDQFVTRAADIEPRYSQRKFSGFTVGKGKLHARLYDKPMEIARKSKKLWMYDVWGFDERPIPEGHRIIRVEFQTQREALKELGIESIDDLFRLKANLWAYCTKKWLQVKDHPERQSHRRRTLPWWEVVQAAFQGAMQAHPLIRAKAIREDRRQAGQQLIGQFTRIVAIDADRNALSEDTEVSLDVMAPVIKQIAKDLDMTPRVLGDKVRLKQAKYERAKVKYAEAVKQREELGLSAAGVDEPPNQQPPESPTPP